jgi:hypothetical protein
MGSSASLVTAGSVLSVAVWFLFIRAVSGTEFRYWL